MSEIQTGLLITVIGMGLVFIMIIILWGLMALLVNITSNKSKSEIEFASEEPVDNHVPQISEIKRKAAAAAVTAALTLRKTRTPEPNTSEMNLWQGIARLKQLQNQGRRGQR